MAALRMQRPHLLPMVGRKPSQEIAGSGGLVQLPERLRKYESAYMGQNSNNNGSNVASVQHFYRDIAIPSTATTVRLQFYLKRTTASASDRFRVFITSTSNTPVSGTFPTTGYTAVYSDNTTTYASFH